MDHSHSKRRQYPVAQYDFSSPAPMAGNPADAQYGYGAQPGEVYTPAAAQGGAIPPNQQFAQLSLGAQAPMPGAPMYGQNADIAGGMNRVPTMANQGYGVDPQSGPNVAVPLNELYNVDVAQELPPHIGDLDLPPPPLVLPASASTTGSEFANAPVDYARCTLNVIPTTSGLLKKSKLPLALILRPSAALLDKDENVPLVEDTVICRCRRCRSYINPFVEFIDQQHRWKCSICGLQNEVPTSFDWDAVKNIKQNRWDRKEVNYGVVDFVASPEYLVRPPQPSVYVFVLDASVAAVSSGLLATTARIIFDSLDRLPNKDGRTRVAFICVDGSLSFFHIPLPAPGTDATDANAVNEPSMMVVTDLEDPFLPCPDGLLVNLNEAREGINKLLAKLGQNYAATVASSNAMGSALKVAHKLIQTIGGKIICVSASLPNVGIAKLEQRDDRKILGTPKEANLFQAGNSFYKSFAIDCNKSQVSIDMFLLSGAYQDVASLSSLPRFTGGQTYFYPGWSAQRESDVAKLTHELSTHLSQEFSMEAVLRVRASTGVRGSNFYGNFFVRSSDLMAFSLFPRDQSYVVEMIIDEPITKPWILIQAALLHTTCHGERRIRTINMAIPTSDMLTMVYASADQLSLTAYYAHKAVEKAMSDGTKAAQELLTNKLVDLFKTYRSEVLNTSSGTLQLSANLRTLPLLLMSLQKHIALRPSNQLNPDLRVAAMNLLTTLPVPYLMRYIYPDFYALHELDGDVCITDQETGAFVLPPRINLTGELLQSYGLYLLCDGQTMFLWVGRDAVPQLLQDAFGTSNDAEIKTGKVELPEVQTELNYKIRALINYLRIKTDSVYWPSLFILKENSDSTLRLWATTFLVEDRTDTMPAYVQYLNQIRDRLAA